MNDIQLLMDELKHGKDIRVKRSLDKLNDILYKYSSKMNANFSYTNIGKISEHEGGPSYPSIRATQNTHYRLLIKAWEKKYKEENKIKIKKNHISNKDFEILNQIKDPSLKTMIGYIIAEKSSYKRQLNILKNNSDIIIDRRSKTVEDDSQNKSLDLLPIEIDS